MHTNRFFPGLPIHFLVLGAVFTAPSHLTGQAYGLLLPADLAIATNGSDKARIAWEGNR